MPIASAYARVARWAPSYALAVVVGTGGSLGVVLESATIGSNPRPHSYQWWLHGPTFGYNLDHVLFYASLALLTLAWASVGVLAFAHRLSTRRGWITLVAWATPLFVGSPVFGRDVYSYIAQGELAHRGFNPYTVAPRVLGPSPLLSSIADVWHNTTSPYGPLFVELTRWTSTIGGGSLTSQVFAFRCLELIGVVLLMMALPSVARHFGVDGGVAIWLGVLSPLALFSAVASAHNDTLMLGLVASALVVALRGLRRWALALIAVAATIKLPALAGAVFLYAAPVKAASTRQRVGLVAEAVAITGLVIVAVTELTGFGWAWLGPHALAIPTQLRVLTSPTVSVGVLFATIARALGLHVVNRTAVTGTQHLGELFAGVAFIYLVVRCQAGNAVRYLGIALLIVVVASPTVWPWYFLWGVTVLGVTSAQRSRFLVLLAGAAMLLVGPGGTPMLGGNGFYVSGVVVVAGVIWFFASRQWRRVIGGEDHVV